VQVVSVPCGTTPSLPANAVSDTCTFYDGSATLGAAPSAGDVTQTQKATSYSGSAPAYTTESSGTFDEYGRVLTAADADNRTTTTAYTPATGAEPTSVTVTDPKALVTTTTYDPARDLPLTVTDPAAYVTTEHYDALGRLTAVWTPGHATTGSALYTFAYSVSSTAPSVVTASTLAPDGASYLPSETLYDSLGRVRETQAETPSGNTDVADTIYNADGWKILTSAPYYVTGAPTATLVAAPDNEVPSQTGYVYDGAGRVTQQISYALASETLGDRHRLRRRLRHRLLPEQGPGRAHRRRPADHVHRRAGPGQQDLPVPRRRCPRPLGPAFGVRPDLIHLHPRAAAGGHHRRGREHMVLRL
jgi:YD repeat-containing protein